jgi:hypothetical protein
MSGEIDNNKSTSVHPAVWTIYAIIATAILFLVVIGRDNFIDVVQGFVLTLTLFAIVWTTFETRSMQKAVGKQVEVATRQTNLSILPVFRAFVGELRMRDEHGEVVHALELQNVGNGIALNVTIDSLDVVPDFEEVSTIPQPHIIFDPVVSIEVGQRIFITHSSKNTKTMPIEYNIPIDWMRHLQLGRAMRDYELKVRFVDIIGNHYIQTLHVGASGSWPDTVTLDTLAVKASHPKLAIDAVFKNSPLRSITTTDRRSKWKHV